MGDNILCFSEGGRVFFVFNFNDIVIMSENPSVVAFFRNIDDKMRDLVTYIGLLARKWGIATWFF